MAWLTSNVWALGDNSESKEAGTVVVVASSSGIVGMLERLPETGRHEEGSAFRALGSRIFVAVRRSRQRYRPAIFEFSSCYYYPPVWKWYSRDLSRRSQPKYLGALPLLTTVGGSSIKIAVVMATVTKP